jgi:hypothetical protein
MSALASSLMGRKGFPGSDPVNSLEPYMYLPKCCALLGWMMCLGRFLCWNLMIDDSKEAPWIALNLFGRIWQDLLWSRPATEKCLSSPYALTGCTVHWLNWVCRTPIWHGEIPGWYFWWARVCLPTPQPICGGGFLQKSTKQLLRSTSSSGTYFSIHKSKIMRN